MCRIYKENHLKQVTDARRDVNEFKSHFIKKKSCIDADYFPENHRLSPKSKLGKDI